MQLDIINFDGKSVGKVELADSVFGVAPRADILHRVVTWQRANSRAGTHAVMPVKVKDTMFICVAVVSCMDRSFAITVSICQRKSVLWV